jgi:hypothetical protein
MFHIRSRGQAAACLTAAAALHAHRHAPKPWSQQQQQPAGPAAPQQHPQQQQQQQQQPAPAQHAQRRGFALGIARKLEGRVYSHRNDVVANNFEGLPDYLIKVVPKWIKFAVAGPAQSNDDHNETTLYTTPEGLLPLMRCSGPRRRARGCWPPRAQAAPRRGAHAGGNGVRAAAPHPPSCMTHPIRTTPPSQVPSRPREHAVQVPH